MERDALAEYFERKADELEMMSLMMRKELNQLTLFLDHPVS